MAVGIAIAAGLYIAGLVVLHQRLGLVEIAALVLVSLASLAVTLGRREPVPAGQPG